MAARALISRLASIRTVVGASGGISRLRFLGAVAVGDPLRRILPSAAASGRSFSTQPVTSSLRDSSPNWSNRPPKETILLDGCDFEHWLVVVEPPPGPANAPDIPRDEIIDGYIKTLAQVVGSEEEARMKIYSVSTRHYFAFGALVSEELSFKLKELPNVRWVLPDSYLDVRNKDYGGEPFIDGQAVPYDPKYHEEWVRNNARAQERSRRSDRPRDRSRNFERRRENMQTYQNRDAPPMQNQEFQRPPQEGPPPLNAQQPNFRPSMPPPGNNSGMPPPPPPNMSTMPPPPPPNMSSMPPPPPPNMSTMPPPSPPPSRPGMAPPPPQGQHYNMPPPPPSPPGSGPGYPQQHYNSGNGYNYQGNPGYQGPNPGGPGPAYGGGGPAYPGQHGGRPSYPQGPAPPTYPQGPAPPTYQGNIPPQYQGSNSPLQPPPYHGGGPAYHQPGGPPQPGQGGPQFQRGGYNGDGGQSHFEGGWNGSGPERNNKGQ